MPGGAEPERSAVADCCTDGRRIMATTPTRIDDELYESAKVVASLMSRSAAQQLAHWARIGREIEAGASVSQRSIAAALAGRLPYDELTPHEQAVVRAE